MPNRRYPTVLVFAGLLLVGAEATAPARTPVHVLLAAGDIASCDSDGDERTAALLDRHPGTVLALGDNAYPHGTRADFESCHRPSWGRHKGRIRPAPGNHDYDDAGAAGYFGYFGAAAGPPGRGYYSFDVGGWHLVSLNSERDTDAAGAQVRWLRKDLARTRATCVLAYWHRPRWSAGTYGDDGSTAALWNALYGARADLVLAGHDHNYQRYPPLNKQGALDRARGIRSFVVGTGGRPLYALRTDRRRVAANDHSFGVLKLTLRAKSYSWRFLPVAGQTYRDSGTAACSPRAH